MLPHHRLDKWPFGFRPGAEQGRGGGGRGKALVHHPGPGLDAGTSQVSLQASRLEHGRRFGKRHDDDLRLMRVLQLLPAARGENVVILEPREDDVFSGRLEAAPGIRCTGLVQTWLDLGAAGERGREAAEHLLQEKLLPAWKEGLAT